MQTNKFRCWTGEHMVDVETLNLQSHYPNILVNDTHVVQPRMIFEKTPFVDIRGYDIYEGDIVAVEVNTDFDFASDNFTHRIVYKDFVHYSISDTYSSINHGINQYREYKIIGNVFSQPEALSMVLEEYRKDFEKHFRKKGQPF